MAEKGTMELQFYQVLHFFYIGHAEYEDIGKLSINIENINVSLSQYVMGMLHLNVITPY